MSRNESTMDDRIREIINYIDDELHPAVSPDHWEIYSHLHDMITSLQPELPKYYDYSEIDDVWEYYAEEQDINLTDSAKQLKDAMWVGYLKGKQDAQSEPLTDKEQRIFLAAMGREEKACKQVDEECRNCREPYEDSLVKTCHAEQKWIPCSERLPEEGCEVLVSAWTGEVGLGTRHEGENAFWRLDTNITVNMANIIAWMPLPKPYKG